MCVYIYIHIYICIYICIYIYIYHISYIWANYNDQTLFSRTLESWWILGKSSPFMAQQFRWVKYSGLYPDLWEWDLPALFDYRRAGEDGKTRLTKSGNKNSIEQHSFVHRTKLYSFVGQRSDAGVWIKTLVTCCSHFTRVSSFSSYWWLFPHENVVLTTCDMNKN